jgi:putative oxidoreductase
MNGLMSFLDGQRANGHLILRLAAGVILTYAGYHKLFDAGIPKIQETFASGGLPVAAFLGAAVPVLEFFGGIAIILGILTRVLGIWMIIQFGLIAVWIKPVLWGKGFSDSFIDLILFATGVVLATSGAGIAALAPKILRGKRWAE